MQKRSANRLRKRLLDQQQSVSASTSTATESRSSEKIPNISWRYIWRTYFLEFDGSLLDDDTKLLSNYGIRNKSVLNFVKKAKIMRKVKKQKKNKK